MARTTKVLIGISLLVTMVTLGYSYLIPKAKTYKYRSYKVDGKTLQNIGETENLGVLRFQTDKDEGLFTNTVKVKLKSKAKKKNGSDISTNDLMTNLEYKEGLEELKFDDYKNNYKFDSDYPMQLNGLIELIKNDGVGYFIFEPINGKDIIDSLAGILCYKIIPYSNNGMKIEVQSELKGLAASGSKAMSRLLLLIPCPPGTHLQE